MKQTILGGILAGSGFLGLMVLCAGAIASKSSINQSYNVWDTLNLFGARPLVIASFVCMGIGVVLAAYGLICGFLKKSK